MSSKIVLEDLQKYSKELEEQHPSGTAYWHLQQLRNEIERVKILNIQRASFNQFELYAEFCIECDRKGIKPLKYKDYLEIG